jgi:hypothetical protein
VPEADVALNLGSGEHSANHGLDITLLLRCPDHLINVSQLLRIVREAARLIHAIFYVLLLHAVAAQRHGFIVEKIVIVVYRPGGENGVDTPLPVCPLHRLATLEAIGLKIEIVIGIHFSYSLSGAHDFLLLGDEASR